MTEAEIKAEAGAEWCIATACGQIADAMGHMQSTLPPDVLAKAHAVLNGKGRLLFEVELRTGHKPIAKLMLVSPLGLRTTLKQLVLQQGAN